MSKTVVVLRGGDLGPGQFCMVRCELAQASAPVVVDWCNNGGRPSGWESTQYQAADCRQSTDGLIDVGMAIAAQGVEVSHEEFGCEIVHVDDMSFDDRVTLGLVGWDIIAIADVLDPYGEKMAGGDVEATAHEWRGHEFTADEVDEWCEIGCWDPATADEFRDAGLTPAQVKEAAAKLVEGLDDPTTEYTDGCPIYSVCNHDTDSDVIVDACIKSPRAIRSEFRTVEDRLRIYDLEPLSSDLRCIAGPDNLDPRFVDPEDLPTDCRWITDDEWQASVPG